jgi:gamma-glutamyltranspeptidase/glutathione hydrolase
VVYPQAGNLGGGGFLVARLRDQTWALDFRETAPVAASRDMFLDAEGNVTNKSLVGRLAAGVPGSVAGLWAAHQKLGLKPWAELVAPAVALAENGFVVDKAFASSVEKYADVLALFPASAALYLPGGKPVAEGSTWKNPELAEALRRIATQGAAGFYQGETAALLVAEMARGDTGAERGLITAEDLKTYQARWRDPLVFTYRGYTIASMSPPSSGGIALAMICRLLEPYELRELAWHSPEELHLLAEAMRRAFAARNAYLGDPDFVENPLPLLLSDGWAKRQRASITARATSSAEVSPGIGSDGSEGQHTTHFSVVDAEGNGVALTTTLNLGYGSAVTVTGAGFLLNNEMDDFAAKPGAKNAFGLVQGPANAIAPKKRMLSSMTPTLVYDASGHVVLALGAAGGPTIITTVFQILSNVIDHGMDIEAAVKAPRMHHQHLPDLLVFEESGLLPEAQQRLEAMGHALRPVPRLADAPSLYRAPSGLTGSPEPRQGGSVSGF